MSAVKAKTIIFQWQKEQDYPVFLRMDSEMLEGRLQKLVSDLGFLEIPEKDHRKVSVSRAGTKVLTLSRAGHRVSVQVQGSDSLDKFGFESLRTHGVCEVYTYRRIGMMVFSSNSTVWELGLVSSLETTEELMGFRVMLNRYLAWALAPHGVIGFWGVATEDGFVVMRQSQSFGEAVYVDVAKRRNYSSMGSRPFEGVFTILRADKAAVPGKLLSPEELVSFLSTHTTYFSQTSLPVTLRKAALTLGSMARGEWSGIPSQSNEGLSNT